MHADLFIFHVSWIITFRPYLLCTQPWPVDILSNHDMTKMTIVCPSANKVIIIKWVILTVLNCVILNLSEMQFYL